MTAGLRVQMGNTPDPIRRRFVSVSSALINTTQSRARSGIGLPNFGESLFFCVLCDFDLVGDRMLVLQLMGHALRDGAEIR